MPSPVLRRALPALGALFMCALTSDPLAADRFSIEQVISAPFSSDLTGSQDGQSIAWVNRTLGVRNVWLSTVRPGGGRDSRRLTHYSADDGLDIGDIAFVPGRDLVAYVRGGDLEYPDKPAANPASLSQGASHEIFLVSTRGGDPVRVGEGHAPVASPDGKRLLFLREGAVFSVAPLSRQEPSRLFAARGAVDTIRFSPDGRRIAFVSQRGDHSFIGVYTFSDQTIRWIDASYSMDLDPNWAPDGRSIVFLRLPSPKEEVGIGPHRKGPPWSIRVAMPDEGTSREIYRAGEGNGSVYHALASEHQLLYTGQQVIFPDERDGWSHLYSVSTAGGSARLLTPGAGEVEWAVLSQDGRDVIYAGNFGDPDRRHLFAANLATHQTVALTSGEGIEVSPVAMKEGALAYLASDARHPIHPALLSQRRAENLPGEAWPEAFPANQLVVPQSVTLPLRAGQTAHGQLFLPINDGRRHPAVIFMHGGPIRQMLAGWHYMDYYSNAYAMNQYLANHGYVVLALNYRAGIGYGFDFREAEHYGAAGASEYNDLLSAAEFLRSRPDVEPSKVGLWGGSYGGYMTALGLARDSDLFAAGVDLHGVHDWYNWSLGVRDRAPYFPADATDQTLATAWSASPLSSVDRWTSPVLLIHGDDDHNVRFDETVRLVRALQERGKSYEELVFPDEIHGFLRHETWLKTYHATADFLDRHLKPQN